MRDFTWHVFTQTGDIEAYLLFKQMNQLGTADFAPEPVQGSDEEDTGPSTASL